MLDVAEVGEGGKRREGQQGAEKEERAYSALEAADRQVDLRMRDDDECWLASEVYV